MSLDIISILLLAPPFSEFGTAQPLTGPQYCIDGRKSVYPVQGRSSVYEVQGRTAACGDD